MILVGSTPGWVQAGVCVCVCETGIAQASASSRPLLWLLQSGASQVTDLQLRPVGVGVGHSSGPRPWAASTQSLWDDTEEW